jgi:uncharacterized membrane protein
LLLWLIFLPNSCYLFTENRHFFDAIERYNLWSRAHHEPDAAMGLGLRAGVALLYSSVGALTFTLSIRPIKFWIRSFGVRTSLGALPFFLLVSLGVYLGLVLRLNSWDLFTRPDVVLAMAVNVANRPLLMLTILLFACFLWVAYEVCDIWVDGFKGRWMQGTGPASEERQPELVSLGHRS